MKIEFFIFCGSTRIGSEVILSDLKPEDELAKFLKKIDKEPWVFLQKGANVLSVRREAISHVTMIVGVY
jgi:hypothetical protein